MWNHASLRFVLVVALLAPAPAVSWQQPASPGAEKRYKIEILSAAGKPQRRRNMISSESVIRVTDQNDTPVAGIAVMFALSNLSGGSATFTNGAASTIVTTNASGIASTGSVTASTASTFNISVSASVQGQTLTATIPMNMASVAAGSAGGAAAGAGAGGAAGGISGAVIGVIAAAGAAAAIVAAKALGGGSDSPAAPGIPAGPTTPANPRIRIGGPGTPTVTGP